MSGDGSPEPRGPLVAFFGDLDEAVYSVERTFVTLAGLVMTTTVTLDIIYRAFASDRSQLATMLAGVIGRFGDPASENTRNALDQFVAPAILTVGTFAAGWGLLAAARHHRGETTSRFVGAIAGLAMLGTSYGFIQILLHVPSRWVCMGLWLGGSGIFLVYAARRRHWRAAAITSIFAPFGAWGTSHAPQDYIWSQELSLILLAWMAFIGASMATKTRKHIIVDALARAIPSKLAPWSRALGLLATMLFCVYVAALAYEHVFGPTGDIASGEIRPATGIPGWVISLSVFTSFVLMSVRFLASTIDAFVRPRAHGPRSVT